MSTTAHAYKKFICAASALSALVIASFSFYRVSFFGFPDGHVTMFQKTATLPLNLLSCLLIANSIGFLQLFFRGSKTNFVFFIPLVSSFILLVFITLIGLPWYLQNYLGLENGHGG